MHSFHGKYREASALASVFVDLLEEVGEPELIVGLMVGPVLAKWNAGESVEAMRLAQRAIDLAGGDPTMGNLIVGSPLAMALALRGSAACSLGIPGWKDDFDNAISMARAVEPLSYAGVVQFKYIAILYWALEADTTALRDTAEALQIAEEHGDDFTLVNAWMARGLTLVRCDDQDRAEGFRLLGKVRQLALEHRYVLVAAWCADLDAAAEMNRVGDHDAAVALSRNVLQQLLRTGENVNPGWATTVLVESLLQRGREADLEEAQSLVARLAAMPTDPHYAYRDVPLLRLNALLARARGDVSGYRNLTRQYRAKLWPAALTGMSAWRMR